MTDKAIVLSSGGIDSTTAMAIAKSKGKKIYSLSFRYGQRHSVELEASKKIARALGAEIHKIIDIDLRQFGSSALTDDIIVPKHDAIDDINKQVIPVTYVPARNTIFLSYAMAWAEVLKATSIYIGVTSVDYSGYPDCRPEFIEAFEKMANLATKTGVTKEAVLKIETPLIHLSKAQIIKTGDKLGVDYALTISCYDPDATGRSCGRCDSCHHRIKGFRQAGIKDPTPYV
ncbi:MAG: 7-cyano-7-deazaguanine synthase QueC [Proteobacteria bacterium]|nr:7-cyano-7-deazaguanine synthase QueC [Pseudomonadota bacterium]MBU1583035.1 7-cyano-7-deazaguanine synthase QueC [Pseudomonadota bacterium]MBU2453414.1 7-cyano-7-deazaguanine synthase QueC [Pseudomonadota bacterium]MBU2631820.1 7-cyano-7-deazaguanine synthase QueC [Pseudomonadota bacterium]